MSEMLLIEEDPDPLPDTENDGTYSDLRAHQTVWAQEEYEHERQRNDIARLTSVANALLANHEGVRGDEYDKRLAVDNSILRRRLVGERHIYFFSVATQPGVYGYTRTWTAESESVNYPLDNEYYESASEVLERLNCAFEQGKDNTNRSLGAQVLAKVLRVVR